MAETQRTVAELLAIFADGQPEGSILPVDMRDFVVSSVPLIELNGSSSVNGSADINPIDMTVTGANLYDTTSAKFVFIDTTDPLNHIRTVKEYTGETGRTLANIGAQRNIFMYMDVSQTPPVIVESLQAPQLQLNEFVSIGNFDLVQVTTPFDTIQGVNTFVHVSYADNDLSQMLHLTRGNFNVFGSEFFPDAGGNLLLDITAGRGIRIGVNSQNDYQKPDIIDGPANTINDVNMQFVDPTGATITVFRPTKEIDVNQFAPGGVLTALGSNKFQIMYLYKFYGSNSIRAHYGDEQFTSLAVAEVAVNVLGPTPQSDQTLEAQLRAVLIVKQGITDLTVEANAKFIPLV